MLIQSERVRELLAKSEAIIPGHIVGTNGKHLSVHVAKDRATRFTSVVSTLCENIAEIFANENIDAVVAPAVGAIALSQWTAHHLTRLRPDRPEVLALYSEHDDKTLGNGSASEITSVSISNGPVLGQVTDLAEGDQVILRKPSFVLKRGFAADVKDKRILGVEDILTTGGSAARTARAITACGGILIGFGVLANGGNVTREDVGVKILKALMTVDRQVFTEKECAAHGLCAQGVPINTNFGHGAAFLARNR